jgi:putative ABC transport system permease protein
MFSRLRVLLRRNQFELDLDDELRLHLELRVADLMRGGHSKDSAERQARLEMGSREKFKDEVRATAGIRFFDELSQDLLYALRILRQSPLFTVVAIGSLALGIGMNTALFSVVNTLLIKSLPYKDADRLVYVTEYWPHEPIVPGPPSPDFANWRDHLKSVDGIAAYGGGANALNLTGEGEPERIEGTMVTWQLLDLLGSTPVVGRNFTEQEDRLGAAPAVILGYGLWQRRFGGSPDVIGKVIHLNDVGRTVVGVLPANFAFPDNNFRHDLLVPMALPVNPNWQDPDHFRLLRVLVRRKAGVSVQALKQDLVSVVQATSAEEPARMVTMRKDMEIRVVPLRQWLTGNIRTMVLVLEGAVAMVLLIACLNIASLQVARAIARKKEIAVRASVGASGARLVRQLLTENLLVCSVAGLAGLLFGYASLGALRTFLPANLHLADMLRLDRTVLAYTLGITLAAGIITGLVPALAALRAGLYDALKEEGRSSGSLGQRRLRGVLVIGEIAAAMVLLVGSSLLIRTFLRLETAGLGFEPKGVLTLKIAPSPRTYPDVQKRAAFCRRILENARAIPGVEAAAIGDALPLVGSGGFAGVSFEGRPQPPVGGRPSLPVAFVSPAYFEALRIPLVRGRAFTEADREPAPLVVIVNQAFATEFFPGENALGKRIEIGSREGRWREIVGIAGNVKTQGRGPIDPYMIYVTLEESFAPETFLILKSNLPFSGLVTAATKAVHAADAAQPVYDVWSMEDRVSKSLATQRANMTLMGVFAALALILATVGIFGVIAYFVNSRVQEIAIRMALGASGRTVVRMVLSHGMALAGAGIAAGIGGALILTRTLGSLVEGIGTNDAVSFVAASLLFGVVAATACSIPARRAARVDPMVALRHG